MRHQHNCSFALCERCVSTGGEYHYVLFSLSLLLLRKYSRQLSPAAVYSGTCLIINSRFGSKLMYAGNVRCRRWRYVSDGERDVSLTYRWAESEVRRVLILYKLIRLVS